MYVSTNDKPEHYQLHGVNVWIYPDELESGDAPLMLTATHDQDSFGMGVSYAHLFGDKVFRFQEQIGTRADLVKVDEADDAS